MVFEKTVMFLKFKRLSHKLQHLYNNFRNFFQDLNNEKRRKLGGKNAQSDFSSFGYFFAVLTK